MAKPPPAHDHDATAVVPYRNPSARVTWCTTVAALALVACASRPPGAVAPGTGPVTAATPVWGPAADEPLNEPTPRGRLPADVRPVNYRLALTVVPDRDVV